MTAAEFAVIVRRCRCFWGSTLRGMLTEDAFDDFVQNVALAVIEGKADDTALGNVCRSVITDMRREQERQKGVVAHATFEMHGNALGAHFVVPSERWGGPRANSGGKRPGAGRPRKVAA